MSGNQQDLRDSFIRCIKECEAGSELQHELTVLMGQLVLLLNWDLNKR